MRSSILLAVPALLFLNVNALRVSTSSVCGKQSWNTLTCKNSSWGNCCSKNGRCGSTPQHCGTGCQAKFGDCKSPVPSAPAVIVSSAPAASKTLAVSSTKLVSSAVPAVSSAAPAVSSKIPAASAAPVTGGKISTDGTCGGTSGFTCVGSSFGNCCSAYGWCGTSADHCSTSCNAAFGICGAASSSSTLSTTAVPTATSAAAPTQKNSVDGSCGTGVTCLGSSFGDCCSAYGWCGSTAAFCATGCQAGFGKCDTPSTSPSLPSTTCGVEGFANIEAYYASSFNLIDTADVSTCATLCLAEAECKSYLFNPKLGNCAYLMNSLEQGEFIATSGTDQLFWERACAEAK